MVLILIISFSNPHLARSCTTFTFWRRLPCQASERASTLPSFLHNFSFGAPNFTQIRRYQLSSHFVFPRQIFPAHSLHLLRGEEGTDRQRDERCVLHSTAAHAIPPGKYFIGRDASEHSGRLFSFSVELNSCFI